MKQLKVCGLVVLGQLFAIGGAFGFSSDGSALARGCSAPTALTNSIIVVTVNFTNGGTDTLDGLFYTDQVPTGLNVSPLTVKIAGQAITNYTLEFGQDGDVYAGYTPCRWVLEQPPGFVQANPVAPAAVVQIAYGISSPIAGSYTLAEFSWAGYHQASTNAAFGYSETADQQTLTFVATVPSPRLSATRQGNGSLLLQFGGVPGLVYRVESVDSSANPVWTTIGTSTAGADGSAQYLDTSPQGASTRFYRVAYP